MNKIGKILLLIVSILVANEGLGMNKNKFISLNRLMFYAESEIHPLFDFDKKTSVRKPTCKKRSKRTRQLNKCIIPPLKLKVETPKQMQQNNVRQSEIFSQGEDIDEEGLFDSPTPSQGEDIDEEGLFESPIFNPIFGFNENKKTRRAKDLGKCMKSVPLGKVKSIDKTENQIPNGGDFINSFHIDDDDDFFDIDPNDNFNFEGCII